MRQRAHGQRAGTRGRVWWPKDARSQVWFGPSRAETRFRSVVSELFRGGRAASGSRAELFARLADRWQMQTLEGYRRSLDTTRNPQEISQRNGAVQARVRCVACLCRQKRDEQGVGAIFDSSFCAIHDSFYSSRMKHNCLSCSALAACLLPLPTKLLGS